MKIKLMAFLLGMLAYGSASALVIDIAHDGTGFTESSTGSTTLGIGDTVTLNIAADANDFWAGTGDGFWGALLAYDSGSRTGDYSWTYSMDGSVVDSGEVLGDVSQYVHIVNYLDGTFFNFDFFSLSYTLTASDSNFTEVQMPFSNWWSDGTPWDYAYVDNAVSVPEPSILALFGIGLAGLGFARRRKQQA